MAKLADVKERKSGTDPKKYKSGQINFLETYKDDKIAKALAWFLENFMAAKSYQDNYRFRWTRYYYMYRQYSPYYQNRPEWQSSYFVPKAFEFVETFHPRLVGALYDVAPLWTALPGNEASREEARAAELLLQTRVNQTNQYAAHYDTLKETLIYGNGIQKEAYVYEPDYTGTKSLPCDLFDLFVDSRGRTIPTMKHITHREVKHINEIMAMAAANVYSKKECDKIKPGGGDKYFSQLDRLRKIGYTSDELGNHEVDTNYHEVLEQWGYWIDADSKEKFEVVAVIVDRQFLVRMQECPYTLKSSENDDYWYAIKPFVDFSCIRVPHEFYAIGLIEMIESMQYELNDRRNAINDALQYAISPVYQYMKGSIMDMDDISFAPGDMVETLVPDAMRPIAKDTGFLAGYQDMDSINKDMENTTGSFDALRGQVSNIRETATSHLSRVQEGSNRVKSIIQNISMNGLREQAKIKFAMERQYTDEELLLPVFGDGKIKEFLKITPSKLKYSGDFAFQANSTYGLKQVKAEMIMKFLEIAANFSPEMLQGNQVNYEMLLKEAAAFMEIPREGLIVKAPPPPEPAPQEAMPLPAGQMPGVPPGVVPMPMPQAGAPGPPGPPPVPELQEGDDPGAVVASFATEMANRVRGR